MSKFSVLFAVAAVVALLCSAPSGSAGPVGAVWVSTHGVDGVGSFTVQGQEGTRVAVRSLQADGSYLLQGHGTLDGPSLTFTVSAATGPASVGVPLFQVGYSTQPSGPLTWCAVVLGNGEFDWLWD